MTHDHYAEEFVLGQLLDRPQMHAWELSGLEVSLFTRADFRAIAESLCAVRDAGRLVHWKRVCRDLRKRQLPEYARLAEALRCNAGAYFGMTERISLLHALRARRGGRAA